jgi:hypothetical protein
VTGGQDGVLRLHTIQHPAALTGRTLLLLLLLLLLLDHSLQLLHPLLHSHLAAQPHHVWLAGAADTSRGQQPWCGAVAVCGGMRRLARWYSLQGRRLRSWAWLLLLLLVVQGARGPLQATSAGLPLLLAPVLLAAGAAAAVTQQAAAFAHGTFALILTLTLTLSSSTSMPTNTSCIIPSTSTSGTSSSADMALTPTGIAGLAGVTPRPLQQVCALIALLVERLHQTQPLLQLLTPMVCHTPPQVGHTRHSHLVLRCMPRQRGLQLQAQLLQGCASSQC